MEDDEGGILSGCCSVTVDVEDEPREVGGDVEVEAGLDINPSKPLSTPIKPNPDNEVGEAEAGAPGSLTLPPARLSTPPVANPSPSDTPGPPSPIISLEYEYILLLAPSVGVNRPSRSSPGRIAPEEEDGEDEGETPVASPDTPAASSSTATLEPLLSRRAMVLVLIRVLESVLAGLRRPLPPVPLVVLLPSIVSAPAVRSPRDVVPPLSNRLSAVSNLPGPAVDDVSISFALVVQLDFFLLGCDALDPTREDCVTVGETVPVDVNDESAVEMDKDEIEGVIC